MANNNPKESRFFSTGIEIRSENGVNTLFGHAAVFNSRSLDLGGFTEFIKPGAFKRALSEKQNVVALFNHDSNMVLGRSTAGTLRMAEDDKGLRFEIDLPNTQLGKDLTESVRRGDITGCSFAFRTVKQEWRDVGGKTERDLLDVDLFDVGPVTYPAYPATDAAVRSMDEWKREQKPASLKRITRARLRLSEI